MDLKTINFYYCFKLIVLFLFFNYLCKSVLLIVYYCFNFAIIRNCLSTYSLWISVGKYILGN